VSSDTWDPGQYERFERERSAPFFDLLDLVEPCPGGRVVDLGCGTGELTEAVTERLAIDEMVGIDSSDAMLAKARARIDTNGGHVRFAKGDISKWTGRNDHDVVLANASLQWVPDHPAVLARWWNALAPGGQLAVQVPANADHPAHRIANQVALTEPFLSAFHLLPPPDPVAENVLSPERYAIVLDGLGAEDQHVRLQVYAHRLASSAEVVEWTRGTSLTRFTKLLPDDLAAQFIDVYRRRVLDVIGNVSPYLYPFKRILMWAQKPA
jgi:trans-aconitate 2-methyltransferase